MFKIDTFRLIKKTFKRFFSLIMIVFIGTAFMMGLMSTETIMKKSVDIYAKDYKLQDLQLYSPFGFCDEDINEIKKLESVENVFASKFVDAYGLIGNDVEPSIIHLRELNSDVNKYELVSGRLPRTNNEIVISNNSVVADNIPLGTHVSLYLNQGDEISDFLKTSGFKIVGKVKTPEFMAKFSGVSTLNNQDINIVAFGNNDIFNSEYYTSVYLTLKDTGKYTSFTNQYNDFINDKKDDVEILASEQQNYLKDKLVDEYKEKIQDGEKELAEKKQEGEKELEDAKRKLDDANIMIVTYESELEILESTIKKMEKLVDDNSETINDGYNQADSFLQDYDIDLEEIYHQFMEDYGDDILEETKKKYNELKYQIQNARKQYEDGLVEYKEGILTFNSEIEKAEIDIKKAYQDLEELPEAKWTILDRSSHYSSTMFENNANQMGTIGLSVPLLFYLVAALVCMTTMTRLIDEQRTQIGIYRALGYSKKQVICKYLTYAFLASFIGSFFGIIVGNLIFPTVIYSCWRLMYNLPPMKLMYPLPTLIVCFLAFTLLMLIVTFFVSKRVIRENPSNLMRPLAPKSSKKVFLEKIPFIWNHLSFTSKITARNLIRYKTRFFMTVIGVAGCTSLLVLGFGIKDSISEIIVKQYTEILNYTYSVNLKNDNHIEEIVDKLNADYNNEKVVPFEQYTSKVYLKDYDDKTISVYVVDPRESSKILSLRTAKGRNSIKLPTNGVIISDKFCRNYDIEIGDYITIESKEGIKKDVEVVDICEWYFQHYIFMSEPYYKNIFDENIHYNTIAIETSDIDSLKESMNDYEEVSSISDFGSFIDQFEVMIQALNFIIIVIMVTAGALAFVVLINLTQVNISERIREIATLKVLGFRNNEVYQYIFKEILLLTLIGAIIGLPLGKVEETFIMNIINMENIMFGNDIKIMSYIYSFLITFIFTIIVLLSTRKNLRQIEMIESLKSVE